MAHLLGSQFCIDSLQNDVKDLQEAITDVFSRAGPVHYRSWKYPDKVASELDIPGILELHEFSDDEEDCQVAHVVLLELVIDRLVLLLHATSRYMDQMLAMNRGGSSQQSTEHSSIGLIAAKYWSKMIHSYTTMQQLQSEVKSKNRKMNDLENTIKKMSEELVDVQLEVKPMAIWSPEVSEALTRSGLTSASSAKRPMEIAKDEYTKSTQTLETAFVPCESCHKVQENLRTLGKNVTNICETQELPSMLAKHMGVIEGMDWLSANDVARWVAEQNKDLNCVNEHLSYLHSTINPLKQEISDLQKSNKQLEEKSEQSKKMAALEKETSSAQQKQFHTKLKGVEKANQENCDKMKRQQDELSRNNKQLETQLSGLKTELGKQVELLQEVEKVKEQLEHDLHESQTNNVEVKRLEGEIANYKTQLTGVQKELSKEQAKTRSVSKQSQSLQDKQGNLVQRLDDLDRENVEIRDQVSELEEEKENLETSLERAQEEKRVLQKQLTDEKATVAGLTRDKARLEESISELRENVGQLEQQVHDAKEKERMLIEYPDLNGPVNKNLIGSGDLFTDMENQVKANSERIRLLEEQNEGLRNSISKMLKAHGRARETPREAFGAPVSLWRPDHAKETSPGGSPLKQEASSEASSPPEPHPPDSQQASRPPKPPSAKRDSRHDTFVVEPGPKGKNRPRSHHRSRSGSPKNTAQASSSSISAYVSLKKAGLLKSNQPKAPDRPPSGRSAATSASTARTDYNPQPVFMCSRCDKMYNNSRDLNVHKSYCTAGI